MYASVGDRIVIKAHHIGEHDRDCEVLDVRDPDGGPPYVVRWEDSGHECLFFPGPDAQVQHFEHTQGDSPSHEPAATRNGRN